MPKPENIEILDAEVIEELSNPDWDFEDKRKGKKPKGTCKKDFSAFNPQTREKLLEVIELGVPLDIASDAAGVSLTTVQRWLDRGEMAQERIEEGNESELAPVEQDFAKFYRDCKQHSAKGVTKLAEILTKASENNPHIALKWIEKVRPDHFGAKQAIEMTGRVAHAHLHASVDGDGIAKKLSSEELRFLRADLAKRKQLEAGDDSE